VFECVRKVIVNCGLNVKCEMIDVLLI
jgi:hypothetical protein